MDRWLGWRGCLFELPQAGSAFQTFATCWNRLFRVLSAHLRSAELKRQAGFCGRQRPKTSPVTPNGGVAVYLQARGSPDTSCVPDAKSLQCPHYADNSAGRSGTKKPQSRFELAHRPAAWVSDSWSRPVQWTSSGPPNWEPATKSCSTGISGTRSSWLCKQVFWQTSFQWRCGVCSELL